MSSQVEPKTGCSPFIGNEAEFIQWMPKIHFCPSIHWSAANLKDTAGANVSALCICQLWCNVQQPYLGCCIFWHEWCGKGTVVTQIEICPIGRQCILTVTLSHLTLGHPQSASLSIQIWHLFMGSLNIQLASDHLLNNSQKELIIVNIQGPTQALALPFGTCMCCNTQQQDISHITYSHQFLRHVMSTLNL